MVQWLVRQKKAYENTEYTNNCFFYHDALTQMNNPVTIRWMKEEDILKYWILPEQGCNAGTAYYDHAVGNTLEVMPLDTSLFNDLDEGVERHIIYTSRLPQEDPRKFSLSTPSRASSAFRRVWKGCPSATRIKQDIQKLTWNMQSIVDAKGCVVPGLGNSGKRYDSKCKKSLN